MGGGREKEEGREGGWVYRREREAGIGREGEGKEGGEGGGRQV